MAYDDSTKPPRPQMSDAAPAPVPAKVPPTRPMLAARALWFASFAAGAAVVIFGFLAQENQLQRLRELVAEVAGVADTQDAAAVDAAAAIAFWGSIIGLAVVIVVEAILVSVMMRGRGGVRWALLVFLVVHAGVLLLADAFLGGGDYGTLFSILLIGQLLLAVAAVIVSLLPSSTAWFRRKQQSRPGVGT